MGGREAEPQEPQHGHNKASANPPGALGPVRFPAGVRNPGHCTITAPNVKRQMGTAPGRVSLCEGSLGQGSLWRAEA